METVQLAAPIVEQRTTNGYRISSVLFQWDESRILVRFTGEFHSKEMLIEGAEALTLMRALNTMDLRSTSLQRRIFNQAITRGVFAGAVTGTPDA
jgi:hypothetical protein